MTVIFLDHDGVLVPKGFESENQFFSEYCVNVLNNILILIDTKIVVSSDWRLHYSLESLSDIYQESGIMKHPMDTTKDFWTKSSNVNDLEKIRADEILDYVKTYQIDKWVAIDDLNLFPFLENFVLTNSEKGLVMKNINETLKYLV